MAGNITLEVVTPEKVVVSEEVQIAVAPGSLGEFGVLVGHTTFLTTLKTGTIHYTGTDGAQRFIFTSGGFAEALPDKLTVLAESAEEGVILIPNVQRLQWNAPRNAWRKKRMISTSQGPRQLWKERYIG